MNKRALRIMNPPPVLCIEGTEVMIFDTETRHATKNLKHVGAWEYSHGAQLLCAAGIRAQFRDGAWRVVNSWTWAKPLEGEPMPVEFAEALLNPRVYIGAQNSFFDYSILRNAIAPQHDALTRRGPGGIRPSWLSFDRWFDTAAHAAQAAYPRGLRDLAQALGLPVEKDMEGNRLVLKHCKPRKPLKAEKAAGVTGVLWYDDPTERARIVKYCVKDVEVTFAAFKRLPELSHAERQLWIEDQNVNLRGFAVDRELVKKTLRLIAEEMVNLKAETHRLTQGRLTSTGQVKKFIEELKRHGVLLPNCQKRTLEDALDSSMVTTKTAKRLIELRLSTSKTSTAKYQQFLWRSETDGRVRDSLRYWGASTGRWSGSGLQPQNFPAWRKGKRDFGKIADDIKAGMSLESLRFIHGEPMELFAYVLRSCIVPTKGSKFVSGDFSGIEARKLFWMAFHEKGLEGFRNGGKFYEELGAYIYGKKVEEIAKDSEERDLGKRTFLGGGFGMGAPKFQQTCATQYGIHIDEATAEKAIEAYRELHWPVPEMWASIEAAAVSAVESPGEVFKANRTRWVCRADGMLFCQLPNGRLLRYPGARVDYELPMWLERIRTRIVLPTSLEDKRKALKEYRRLKERGRWKRKPVLSHLGDNSRTRKWERQRSWGGVLTENCVQASSRDLMADAMMACRRAGFRVVLTVHDELLVEAPEAMENAEQELAKIMIESSPWAHGLPVNVDTWSGRRYRK